jgi:hypothetical protein
MGLRKTSIAILFLSVFAAESQSVCAQKRPAYDDSESISSLAKIRAVQESYAQAKTYADLPLSEIKSAVPALKGIHPKPGQEELNPTLYEAAKVLVSLLPRVPNLISDEELASAQIPLISREDGKPRAYVNYGDFSLPYIGITNENELQRALRTQLSVAQKNKYSYILATHTTDGKEDLFDEYRTDANNQSITPSSKDRTRPHGVGFSCLWLIFLPGNLKQSHFRYLGDQKVEHYETSVVAFAQDPTLIRVPGEIEIEGTNYPLFQQGIAWIDKATHRIVKLHTDLLAPLPSIQLERASSDLNFKEVRIPDFPTTLWLPKEVIINWEYGLLAYGELHRYSNYRLFRATARILPN